MLLKPHKRRDRRHIKFLVALILLAGAYSVWFLSSPTFRMIEPKLALNIFTLLIGWFVISLGTIRLINQGWLSGT